MRISLFKPSTTGILGLEMITLTEPLGLECIAGALLETGHECSIVDLRLESLEKGLSATRSFGPQIIGVQCSFTTERPRVVELVSLLNNEFPGALVVVGGHDASRDPEWFASCGLDAVIIGDGEDVVVDLAEAVAAGRDLNSVRGLMLCTKSGPVYTGPAEIRKNPDELPLPARKLVRKYAGEYYMSFCKPLAPLETARGCPYSCNFCSVWKFHRGTYREKSPERVLRELSDISSPNIFITDDIFWLNVKRCEELARGIQAAGRRRHFFIQTRTDIIMRHPDLVKMWRDCGQLTIFLGLEKIDDEGLESVNKKNSANTNERAIELLQELGVGYTANFIVDPQWDHADFANLRNWVKRTGSYNSAFSILTPLPGIDLWDEMKSKVDTSNFELFDLEHTVLPTKLPLEDFYAEYASLWKCTQEVRSQVRGTLQPYLRVLAGLALRKTTLSALRKGLLAGRAMSDPKLFLAAHDSSPPASAAFDRTAPF